MSRVLVARHWSTPEAVCGRIYIDGLPYGYTLEPALNAALHPAIPTGTFPLRIRWSNRFKRLMPHVENVPGRDGILLHWGNRARDTEGCILIGSGHMTDMVLRSLEAFDKFYQYLLIPSLLQPDDDGGNPQYDAGTITVANQWEDEAPPVDLDGAISGCDG